MKVECHGIAKDKIKWNEKKNGVSTVYLLIYFFFIIFSKCLSFVLDTCNVYAKEKKNEKQSPNRKEQNIIYNYGICCSMWLLSNALKGILGNLIHFFLSLFFFTLLFVNNILCIESKTLITHTTAVYGLYFIHLSYLMCL